MTEHALRPIGGVAPKRQDHHLRRQAIVYGRQSHPQQVLEHVESTARHDGLVDRAVTWGWARDRIVVIDADPGQSGQSMVTRRGFQRLVAEVSLDHVGLILGLEMSRLARSHTDWPQLLERGAIFRTRWADADGLDDPTADNDRFVLGLRGMMHAAELSGMTGRLLAGRRHQAQRGDLVHEPPWGSVRGPDGDDQLDPDAQAQRVVRLICDVCEPPGRLHGVWRYRAAHDMRLPIRPHTGPARGQLAWHRPSRTTWHNLWHHPISAGASRWGHRLIDPRQQQPGRPQTGRPLMPAESCEGRIKDRVPASLSWERLAWMQPRVADNRSIAAAWGAPRAGPSLRGGFWVCGRCGRRFLAASRGKANRRRDPWRQATMSEGAPGCLRLAGTVLDACVAAQVRQVRAPASWAWSLAAEQAVRAARAQLEGPWQPRLERARDAGERAARQSAAVEPETRLGARELEKGWEKARRHEPHAHEASARFRQERPAALTPRHRDAIRRFSHDVPGLWPAPPTTAKDRQEIVRLLLERVTVDVQGACEQVAVTRQWAGGCKSAHSLIRPGGR